MSKEALAIEGFDIPKIIMFKDAWDEIVLV
jgi:hypothetical protein